MTLSTDLQAYDDARWLGDCLAATDGRVSASPAMAQLATEHAFGRRLAASLFVPLKGFSPVLLAPDRRTVMGGQARGPFAIVPMAEPGTVTLRFVLWRWMGPDFGSPGWLRVAAFLDAQTALLGARLLHEAGGVSPAWLREEGMVDIQAVERVLVAGRMMPGRIGPSPLRVYARRP